MLVPQQVWLTGTSIQGTMPCSLFHHTSADGKRLRQQQATTCPAGASSTSRLFYVTDLTPGTRFLENTGADVSVLPSSTSDKRKSASLILQAVYHSAISTLGKKSLTLNFGLRRCYRWIFQLQSLVLTSLIASTFLQYTIYNNIFNDLSL